MICQNCSGTNDVAQFYIGEEEHALCVDCRAALLRPARGQQSTNQLRPSLRPPGRPSLGTTRKVSITLPDETWEWFDSEAEKLVGSRSALLRYLISREQSPESRWSNNACLGYAILGAQKLGYTEEETQELVRAIYGQFDWKSVEDAKEVYNSSPY